MKMSNALAEGLQLLNAKYLQGLLSQCVLQESATSSKIIMALVQALQDSLGTLMKENSRIFLYLVKVALDSGDTKLGKIIAKYIDEGYLVEPDLDLQTVSEALKLHRRTTYPLICHMLRDFRTVRAYILQHHVADILSLDTADLCLFADALTLTLVSYDDREEIFINDIRDKNVGVASDILHKTVQIAATPEKIRLEFKFFIRALVLTIDDENMITLYGKIDSALPRTLSIERLAFVHALLISGKTEKFPNLDATRYIKSALQSVTRFLSESSQLSDLQIMIIKRLSIICSQFSQLLGVGKSLNAVIEVSIQRWFTDNGIMRSALAFMMSSSQQPHNLEYQKFLQMLLNNDQSRSQESGGFPYYIICAMHFLYFLDPKEQSKASMMTPKILQFYSGTYNPADRLILEIIYSLDASVNISSEMRIESYSFPQEQKKLYNFAVGHCEMSFSSKVFRNSIKTLSNKSGAYSYQKFETVMEYIAVIEKFTDSQEQDLVYDPLFVLPAIADMVSRKLVSVNSMVDSHCLSYVVICLGLNARVAGMARKILNSSISLIDVSVRFVVRNPNCLLI